MKIFLVILFFTASGNHKEATEMDSMEACQARKNYVYEQSIKFPDLTEGGGMIVWCENRSK